METIKGIQKLRSDILDGRPVCNMQLIHVLNLLDHLCTRVLELEKKSSGTVTIPVKTMQQIVEE